MDWVFKPYEKYKAKKLLEKQAANDAKYEYYKTTACLPIWNYNEIENTNDLRFLLRLSNYETLPEYFTDLSEIWNSIKFSFSQKSDSIKHIQHTTDLLILREMGRKVNMIKTCYFTLTKSFEIGKTESNAVKSCIDVLHKYGFRFEGEFVDALIDLDRQYKAMVEHYQRKEFDLKEKYDSNEKVEKVNIYDLIEPMQKWSGVKLDPKVMPVDEFLALKSQYMRFVEKQNSEAEKQNLGKRKVYGK